VQDLGLDTDRQCSIKASVYRTSIEGVFACGDARVGESLVVTAIADHSLRYQAETAGAVTVGDAFWSGPRDE
jgi:glutamate synthase (NADPH) small chain